jgi:hypothetical protein
MYTNIQGTFILGSALKAVGVSINEFKIILFVNAPYFDFMSGFLH